MSALDVARATRLRLRCTCGADIGLPLDRPACPSRCFRCAAPLPAPAINEACASLRWMAEASSDDGAAFSLSIEGDPA